MKPFTIEGRVECGLEQIVAGKVWAYVAVVAPECAPHPYGLGVAAAHEPGYWPIPLHWCHGHDYQEMQNHADQLNDQLGHTRREAAIIIGSSMFNNPGQIVPAKMPAIREIEQNPEARAADEGTDPIDERAADQDHADMAAS